MTNKEGRARYLRMLRLAWPTIFENIAITFVGFVDIAMVGSLGKEATASVAINASPTWLISNIVLAISIGGMVLVAHSIGAGEQETARSASRQALMLSLVMGVLAALLLTTLGGYIPRLMGAEAAILPDAMAYMRIVGSGYLLSIPGMVVSSILRGTGNAKTPMIVNTAANLFNMVGNFLLIYPARTITVFAFSFELFGNTVSSAGLTFGMWGAGLGVPGAAISTAASMLLSGLALLLVLFLRESPVRQSLRGSWKPRWDLIRRMMRVGVPAALERVVINVGQIFFNRMVAGLGTLEVATHYLAVQAESISYMPAHGFAAAATTLVGQAMGKGDPAEARRDTRATFIVAMIVSVVMAVCLFAFASPLISIFTPDPEVIALGAVCLRIVSVATLFLAVSIVYSGALRGAGDTRVPVVLSMASMFLLRLPAAALFTYVFGMGLPGLWWAMLIDLSMRGVLIALRYRQGRWKAMKV